VRRTRYSYTLHADSLSRYFTTLSVYVGYYIMLNSVMVYKLYFEKYLEEVDCRLIQGPRQMREVYE